jgi:hypothetical protein
MLISTDYIYRLEAGLEHFLQSLRNLNNRTIGIGHVACTKRKKSVYVKGFAVHIYNKSN